MARSFGGTSSDTIAVTGVAASAAITLSIWFKVSNTTPTYTAFMSFNFNGNSNLFDGIYVKSTGKMAYYVYNSGAGGFLDPGSATITTGVWNHAALTYDSTNGLSTYLNGVSDGTVVANGAGSTGMNEIDIGGDINNATTRIPTGSLADAAWWNIALTSFEISALAAGARPYTIRPASLLGWWPLDGIQSPEPDLSGFAHNGTVTGTALAFGPPFMPFTPRWPMGGILPITVPPTFVLMPQIVM